MKINLTNLIWNLIRIFFLFSLVEIAHAGEPYDKEFAEEYKIFVENEIKPITLNFKNKIFQLYKNTNDEIKETDVDDLSKETEIMSLIQYAGCTNNGFEMRKNYLPWISSIGTNYLDSGKEVVIQNLIDYQNICNKIRVDFKSLSLKVKNKEVKNNFKQNIDLISKSYFDDSNRNKKIALERFDKVTAMIKRGEIPRSGNLINKREQAKNDVVAQALNYASGMPEDASGANFWYPVDNSSGNCLYSVSADNSAMGQFSQSVTAGIASMAPILGAVGVQVPNTTSNFDFTKVDFSTIAFYKLNGTTPRTRNSQETPYLRYQSKIDGMPDLFECDSNSCSIERLQRAWSLIAKTCKGVNKPF